MRRLLISFAVVALALSSTIPATRGAGVQIATFVSNYDIASGTMTYCNTTGKNADPWQSPREGRGLSGTSGFITTSGSSTTVTAVVSAEEPFTQLAVGDILIVRRDATTDQVYITAKASGHSVTVSSAVNWQNGGLGFPWQWLEVNCGTTAADGWINVQDARDMEVKYQVDTLNGTSIDVRVECRDQNLATQPFNIYPGTAGTCPGGALSTNLCRYTAAGINTRTSVLIPGHWQACRVGFALNTDTGAQSVSAHVARSGP